MLRFFVPDNASSKKLILLSNCKPLEDTLTLLQQLFFYIYNFFSLSITTKYIQQLITKLLKIKLIKQDNAGHLFYFFLTNKTNTHTHTHTHTHTQTNTNTNTNKQNTHTHKHKHKQTNTNTHTHKDKKENEMKLLAPAPLPFHFERSINQSYDQWDAISLIT